MHGKYYRTGVYNSKPETSGVVVASHRMDKAGSRAYRAQRPLHRTHSRCSAVFVDKQKPVGLVLVLRIDGRGDAYDVSHCDTPTCRSQPAELVT